jgi:hypothetical protein
VIQTIIAEASPAINTDTRTTAEIAASAASLRRLRQLQQPPLTCAFCGDPCGLLQAGRCLSCHLDFEEATIIAGEARLANDYFPA